MPKALASLLCGIGEVGDKSPILNYHPRTEVLDREECGPKQRNRGLDQTAA
jgi:hypothetical protein